jgi:hypothetical protein
MTPNTLETINFQKDLKFPSCFDYSIEGNDFLIKFKADKIKSDEFRKVDPWALTKIQENGKVNNCKIEFLPNSKVNNCHFEALRRRISFLNINNQLNFQIFKSNQEIELYTAETLFSRPKNEIINTKLLDRNSNDKLGRPEKDFQAYLFGLGYHYKDINERSNYRLGLLGEDFFNIKRKRLPLIREFPTGVYNEEVSKNTRILSNNFVDIVSLNKWEKIAIIELKLDDTKIEVISQILDYALFMKCYYAQIIPLLNNHGFKINPKEFVCYFASNKFHPKLDNILNYYSTKNKNYGFQIKKITLGKTEDL